MKKIFIIGATSAIASACARLWAEEKASFFLAARDENKLRQTADDLMTLGALSARCFPFDANDYGRHAELIETGFGALGHIDIALVAHGTLPDQKACERDVAMTLSEFSSNGLSVIALLTVLAARMEPQKSGTIAVISSVAGDRGRPSNYVYGAAKSAVSAFCEGLRARLFSSGVQVLTIKPGFVDTPMTANLKLPRVLVASPAKVAQDIVRAIDRKRNVIYTPFFWEFIMAAIMHIPQFLFKRMKL